MKKSKLMMMLAGGLLALASCGEKDSAPKETGILPGEKAKVSDVEVIKFDSAVFAELRRQGAVRSVERQAGALTVTEIYFNAKDSVTTRFIRDTTGLVYSMTKDQAGERIFAAEYYANGQLKGKVNFSGGVIDGPVRYYYEDGRVRSEGVFRNADFYGRWNNYDESGKLVSVEEYDENGAVKRYEVK